MIVAQRMRARIKGATETQRCGDGAPGSDLIAAVKGCTTLIGGDGEGGG